MPSRGARCVPRHRRARPARQIAGAAATYLRWHSNVDYEPAFNGELRVVRAMSRLDPAVVFDVGANVGDWTETALEAFPAAHVHCFEIVPATADALAERHRSSSRVTVNPVGLSEASGEVTVTYHPDASVLASVFDASPYIAADDPRTQHLNVAVTTGDDYCSAHGIEHIDLLKIDTEGLDLRVIKGFSGMLQAGAVRVVQFEYGIASIYSKDLLRDFYEYLTPLGFAVGKVFPTYVDFRDYTPADENFLGPNCLAVREPDIPIFA